MSNIENKEIHSTISETPTPVKDKLVTAESLKLVSDIVKTNRTETTNLKNNKLDKNQGAEHAGKALVVGEDGNVIPGKPQTEGVGDGADAILNTATGNLLLIKDSSGRKNKGFGMSGKTEQVTTTGAQLFDENTVTRGIVNRDTGEVGVSNSYSTSDYISVVPKKQYSINSFASYHFCYYSPDKKHISAGDNTSTFTVPDNVAYIRFSFTTDKLKEIILCEGSKLLPHEPYTGGKPSPSPEYPQEILNAGQLNEDTGKYEIDVRVTGKNLIDEIALKNFENYTKQGIVYYVYRIRGLVTGAQYTLSRGKVSSGNKMIFGISTNGQSYDNSSFLIYDGLNNTYNRESITWIQNNNDYADILFSYNSNSSQTTEERLKELFDRVEYIQLEYGKNATVHEVFREPQTLTLTSDRPLTKWDRLVEQDGQIGWLYSTGEIMLSEITLWSVQKDNLPDNRTQRIYAILNNAIKNQHCYATKYYSEEPSVSSIKLKDYECIAICNGNYLMLKVDRNIGTTSEDYVNYFGENDDKVIYNSTDQEFVPLPQEQQDAIRALSTYYPSTVVSNSENMEMELSYVADTKNYIDKKFEELNQAIVNTQIALL